VAAAQVLDDGREVREDLDERRLRLDRDALVAAEPSADRLEEEDRALLRQEDDWRVECGRDGEELPQGRGGLGLDLVRLDAGERGGELVLVALEPRRLEEDGLDRVQDGARQVGCCERGATSVAVAAAEGQGGEGS